MSPRDHSQWLNLQMPLALSGHNFSFLLFHPCLVSRIVQRIIHNQASGILVIPRWKTQPFFTVALNLLIDMPLILKASAQNLVHRTLGSPHPLHQRLELMVCKLSGNPCNTRISPNIVEVIMQFWRESTHKQYKVYINKWLQSCGEGLHDPLHPCVRSVLSFLHSLVKKGLSYCSL